MREHVILERVEIFADHPEEGNGTFAQWNDPFEFDCLEVRRSVENIADDEFRSVDRELEEDDRTVPTTPAGIPLERLLERVPERCGVDRADGRRAPEDETVVWTRLCTRTRGRRESTEVGLSTTRCVQLLPEATSSGTDWIASAGDECHGSGYVDSTEVAMNTIENPVTGERIEFREATDRALRFDYYLRPGGFATGKVDHVHPKQEEQFRVRSGQLGVRIDGDEWTATAGTGFSILPETPHTIWNDGEGEMHAVVEIRPALELKSFFETMYGLARDGRTNRWGLPNALQLAVIANAFQEELYFAGVPRLLQRGVTAAAAPVGRLAGYQSRYARYGDPGTLDL